MTYTPMIETCDTVFRDHVWYERWQDFVDITGDRQSLGANLKAVVFAEDAPTDDFDILEAALRRSINKASRNVGPGRRIIETVRLQGLKCEVDESQVFDRTMYTYDVAQELAEEYGDTNAEIGILRSKARVAEGAGKSAVARTCRLAASALSEMPGHRMVVVDGLS